MKVPTNMTGKTIDPGTRATRDFKPAQAKRINRCAFERSFCGVLIALIFVTVVMVSVVLTISPAVLLRGLMIL